MKPLSSLPDANDGKWKAQLVKNVNSLVSGSGNVLNYGAQEGGTIDATAAIQAAINSGVDEVIINGTYLIGAGGLLWKAGVKISGNGLLKRTATPTAGLLRAEADGDYVIEGVRFDDGGHSVAVGMIEVDHATARLTTIHISQTNGYSCIWAKQAESIDIDGGDYSYSSHNLYFGDNVSGNLPGTIQDINVRGANSHHALTGGDGLKTVSGVKRLNVVGGHYHHNAADGIDCYAGCDEATFLGVSTYLNDINGYDIKQGAGTEAESTFGLRRRISIIGGHVQDNTEVGIKIYGEHATGWFEDCLVMGVTITGNEVYAIQNRGIATRIIGNLIVGNATSTASSYSVIYFQGDASNPCRGGIVSDNVIGNNGVTGKTNTAINVNAWDTLSITGNTIGNDTLRDEDAELDIGIITNTDCSDILIDDNTFTSCNTNNVQLAVGTVILGDNVGITALARGTDTIASGTTSKAINHGLGGRPSAYTQVQFWALGDQYGAGVPYTGVTSTTQINAVVATAPTSNMFIGWQVDLRGEVNTFAITE